LAELWSAAVWTIGLRRKISYPAEKLKGAAIE
jgi:hypothetical protein